MKKKIISMVLCVVMIAAMFTIPAFAKTQMNADLGFDVFSKSLKPKQLLNINLTIELTAEVEEAEGVSTMSFGVSFNNKYFDIVDPYTGETLSFNDRGEAVGGTVFMYGEIGAADSLAATMNKAGNSVFFVYGGLSNINDIYESGPIFRLAFRVKEDAEIKDSAAAMFKITDPKIVVNNKDVDVNVTTKDASVSLLPPFNIDMASSVEIGSPIEIGGTSSLSDGEMLNVKVKKNGETVEEKRAEVSRGMYDLSFDTDSSQFAAGTYTVEIAWNNTSATKGIKINDKKQTDVTPDNKDDNNNNNNNSGNGNTPGGINGGSNTNTSAGKDDKKGNDQEDVSKDTEKNDTDANPTVTYPSDIALHWAEEYIKYVYDYALMNGYEDGSFLPEASITRAEFSTVMARLLKLEGGSDAADKFVDLDGHWAKEYISALAEAGIVGGVSDSEFAPDENITREQMAAILARALDLSGDDDLDFADADDISDWARVYVSAVKNAGYMRGDGDNCFAPLNNATRAEVATVICRLHSAM